MRKKLAFSVFVAIACAIQFVPAPILSSAEEGETQTKYTVEFTDEKIYAPALLQEGQRYTASLYAYDDTTLSSALTGNFHDQGYTFTECGKYCVVYSITDLVSGETSEKKAELIVEDTTSPTIVISDIFAEYAEIGEKIEIYSATATDLSGGNLDVSVRAEVGGKQVAVDERNSFIVSEEGEYTIVYSATDLHGNTAEKECSFIAVKATKEEKKEETGGFKGVVIGVLAVLVCAALLTFVYVGAVRKRRKK